MAANDFNNNFENAGDVGGGAVGNGASVDTDSILFLKNIKYTSEELSNITTNSQLEKILGVKNLILKDWWINEDKYLCFSLTPSFKKDVAAYVKFKDKNDVSYYLDVEDKVASSFPYHKKTYEEAMKTDTMSINNHHVLQETMYSHGGSAFVGVKIFGSLPEINKLISYNSISGVISGTITYSSNMTMIRESFSKSFSISDVQDSWSTKVTITTNDACDEDSAVVFISSCSTTLNYTSWVENNIVYYLGLSEVGYAIKKIDAFMWENNKSIDSSGIDINNLTLVDCVNSFKTENITSDMKNKYGDVIWRNNLQLIAKNRTLPRYNIQNKQNFRLLSFDKNILIDFMDKKDNSGQYVFSDGIYNSQYWGFKPQIYPVVVFNNTDDNIDSPYIDVNGSQGYYEKLNQHSISITDNSVSVDKTTYTLYPNDEIVCYIRQQGEWKPDTVVTYPGLWVINESSKIEYLGGNYKGTLEMKDMDIYVLNNMNLTFDCSSDNLQYFTSTECKKGLYRKIINTYNGNWSFPQTTGADQAHAQDANWYHTRRGTIFAIGDYSWEFNNEWKNITKNSNANISLTAYLKNFQYLFNRSSFSFTDTPSARNTTTRVDEISFDYDFPLIPGNGSEYETNIQNATFYMKYQPPIGSFPSKIGLFQNIQDIKHNEKDNYNVTEQWLKIDDTSYEFVNNSQHAWGNTYVSNFQLKFRLGYESWINKKTFAMAVVIWRNGKLIDELVGEITYSHSIKNNVLTLVFYNPNNVDVDIKLGSPSGYFSESLWGKAYGDQSSIFNVDGVDDILAWVVDPFFEYYDPYLKKNIKVLISSLK